MGKGSSGHKSNDAAKRNRAIYKAMGRYEVNKKRKERKENRLQAKLWLKDKGIYKGITFKDLPPALQGIIHEDYPISS